jgi:hypothetical protein
MTTPPARLELCLLDRQTAHHLVKPRHALLRRKLGLLALRPPRDVRSPAAPGRDAAQERDRVHDRPGTPGRDLDTL